MRRDFSWFRFPTDAFLGNRPFSFFAFSLPAGIRALFRVLVRRRETGLSAWFKVLHHRAVALFRRHRLPGPDSRGPSRARHRAPPLPMACAGSAFHFIEPSFFRRPLSFRMVLLEASSRYSPLVHLDLATDRPLDFEFLHPHHQSLLRPIRRYSFFLSVSWKPFRT